MTETKTYISLGELNTIRLFCKNPKCGAVLECRLDESEKVPDPSSKNNCRFCGEHTATDPDWEYLDKLAKAFQALQKSDLQIKFVLTEDTEENS